MLGYADWIVGAVSIAIGAALFFSAMSWRQSLRELPKVRWLEARLGRPAAQAILMVIGAALVVVGIAVGLGWKMNWQPRPTVLNKLIIDTWWA